MDLALQLGIAASLVQLAAYFLYYRRVLWGRTVPNTAAWTLWALLATLTALSYVVMTHDPAKYALPSLGAGASFFVWLYSLQSRKFQRMDRWEWLALGVGMIGAVIWVVFRSAAYGNGIAVIAESLGFVPLCRAVWNNPSTEKALPWYIWSFSYAMLAAVVALDWSGHPAEFIYPGTMCALHLSIGLFASRRVPVKTLPFAVS